jgi:hypothetical protein
MNNEIDTIMKSLQTKKKLRTGRLTTEFYQMYKENIQQCFSRYSAKYKGKQQLQTHSVKPNFGKDTKKEKLYIYYFDEPSCKNPQ